MDINLRDEFAKIMLDHGHWMLLRHRVEDRYCYCYNQVTGEGSLQCPKCMGTGFAFIDSWVQGRKMTRFEIPEMHTSSGRMAAPLIRFWVKHTVRPDRGDFLCEVALDSDSHQYSGTMEPNRPVQIVRIYDIQDVDDMREMGGRVEYFRLLVEEADLGDTS